jgi:predicted TIM-barrel enzyme
VKTEKEAVMAESKQSILQLFREKIRHGRPIIGGGAGTGISAKFEEARSIDLIVIYNSGRFRMAGHGSMAGLLPFGDANAIVMDMAREVLPVIRKTPVLAGVCGTDPMRLMPRFLREIRDTGFAGVQNFPTVGLFDGTWRRNLEETGFGYEKEVEMIRIARDLDLLTTPYVFNEREAELMAGAGADLVVAHLGTTISGSVGVKTAVTLEEGIRRIDRMAGAAKSVRGEVIVLCHNGPIAGPDNAQCVLSACGAVEGFYGASSMERLPVERAIREQTEAFVRLRTGVPRHGREGGNPS